MSTKYNHSFFSNYCLDMIQLCDMLGKNRRIKVVLSGVSPQVFGAISKSELKALIGIFHKPINF